MDEEDLAQMNEDRQLENTETFRSDAFTGTREELANKEFVQSAHGPRNHGADLRP